MKILPSLILPLVDLVKLPSSNFNLLPPPEITSASNTPSESQLLNVNKCFLPLVENSRFLENVGFPLVENVDPLVDVLENVDPLLVENVRKCRFPLVDVLENVTHNCVPR